MDGNREVLVRQQGDFLLNAPTTFADCLAQEDELLLENFSQRNAMEIGLAVIEAALELTGKPIAVHVQNHDHPLFTHFMDGTGPVNWDWIGKKSRVVHVVGHSSWGVGIDYRERGLNFNEVTRLDPELFRAEGGSIPLIVRNHGCVGSVTVSGLLGDEDHEVAVEGLRRWLKTTKK